MRLSAAALDAGSAVAAHGNRAAASDVGVGVALLRAGLRGARLNVEINLGSVTDAGYVERGHRGNRSVVGGGSARRRRSRRATCEAMSSADDVSTWIENGHGYLKPGASSIGRM